MRFPGGLVRATPKIPTTADAKGIWTVREALQAKAQGIWPSLVPVTSYANAGGTGNRTASITVTQSGINIAGGTLNNFVDGAFTAGAGDSVNNNGAVSAGAYTRFDFGVGVKKYIDEVKIYTDRAMTNGAWQWYGSDNASSWTALHSEVTWTGNTQTMTLNNVVAAGYRYYEWRKVTAGVTLTDGWYIEFEFKIAAGV